MVQTKKAKAEKKRKSSRPARKPARKPAPREPGKRGRPVAGTVDWADAFLAALLDGVHVRDACDKAVVDSGTVYHRKKKDEAFRLAWEQAIAIGTNELAAEAARRAYHGTLKPVFQAGVIPITIIRFNELPPAAEETGADSVPDSDGT
jgi:hypothetical protein